MAAYSISPADSATCVRGISYDKFPLITDAEGRFLEPAMTFLAGKKINVRASKPKTLRTYAEHLCDLFSFYWENNIDWRDIPQEGEPGILHLYRAFCLDEAENKESVTNQKLGTAVRFYSHMRELGRVTRLPYTLIERVCAYKDYEAGVTYYKPVKYPDVISVDVEPETKFITCEEIERISAAFKNNAHFLIFMLMLALGLRLSEVISFPLKYVLNPNGFSGKQNDFAPHNALLRPICLNPRDMRIKWNKSRIVYISPCLMRRLYDYMMMERPSVSEKGSVRDELFLNRFGRPFDARGVQEFIANAGRQAELRIALHPHILRHTYATHELCAVEKLVGAAQALKWVQERLGHSSQKTTERYVHVMESEKIKLFNGYQAQLDRQLGYAV